MDLENFLTQHQSAILKRWFNFIIDTYPPETAKLFKREKDPFANPVGSTIFQGMQGLYQELVREIDPETASPFLDKIIRIRAIQDFSPSRAIAFVFVLKDLVREQSRAADDPEETLSQDDLTSFDGRIDRLAMLAFDIYVQCREKLYELRVNEVKNRTHRLLQRANLLAEIPDQEPSL
ncbi:RsbRD N-terminal domain-containing protein [Desulfoferrobacter suflitae]|uniref:RsbRD N-terminal domain-containing protein n=1 Tax=Desulfoferrobacter suflitae TaxID=2865782 RepID=UPI002164D43F|nr:RsbRD N-terminal domain-containing protein [Desulfoferrobacter suflitae]MCK8601111.1 RsbRD N-terminal domain-containing protein [Desulfoferrobacter suflitae]